MSAEPSRDDGIGTEIYITRCGGGHSSIKCGVYDFDMSAFRFWCDIMILNPSSKAAIWMM